MWILNLRIVHDCVIGNRCRKFGCTSYSLPISNWYENGFSYTTHLHTLHGPTNQVAKFIAELKKEPEVVHIEVSKNTVFLIQKRKTDDVISAHYNPKIFSVRPVFVTAQGKEYCSFASWKKEILIEFLEGMRKNKKMDIVVERFQNTKLDTIYYPTVMPKLSERQLEAFELALEYGYYAFPRRIELQGLAKVMKISTSTMQEHIRRAEEKLLPTYAAKNTRTNTGKNIF